MAAGDIDDIARLAKTRDAAAKRPNELASFPERHAEMRGPGRLVEMMQVVGFDAILDEGAHELGERFDVVVHAAEQDRLTDQRNACVDQAGQRFAAFGRELARMVRVDGHVERRRA